MATRSESCAKCRSFVPRGDELCAQCGEEVIGREKPNWGGEGTMRKCTELDDGFRLRTRPIFRHGSENRRRVSSRTRRTSLAKMPRAARQVLLNRNLAKPQPRASSSPQSSRSGSGFGSALAWPPYSTRQNPNLLTLATFETASMSKAIIWALAAPGLRSPSRLL